MSLFDFALDELHTPNADAAEFDFPIRAAGNGLEVLDVTF